MWPNPQFPTDLVTFIEEIHDEKLSSMKLQDLKGLKDLHKTFWGTTKKFENKNLN